MDFKIRSTQLELIDDSDIPAEALHQNLKELAFINTYLGGFQISARGLSQLLTNPAKKYHVVDIGCGGGDTLITLANWAKKNKFTIQFTGVDMKADAINYARENCKSYPNIQFIVSDYKLAQFNQEVDVVVSTLFCHHLNEVELQESLVWMKKTAKIGFVINDLHRSKIAYYSIKWLTAIFSKSYLVKNDAAVSVSRGFKKSELQKQLNDATISGAKIKWVWAFRYLVIAQFKG
jgi:2-polyprenyl-3-methyl-5-hydroxy-6-metoxy-1,4-benzoquinol methylase